MSGEDRADRLRKRRQRARNRARADKAEGNDETGGTEKTAKPDETAKTDDTEKTDEAATSQETDAADEPKQSVKDVQKPTYMYLPHAVRRDLDRSYSMLKAEYEYEYGESFEKNRHFYPLVVALGLEAVEELDPGEVRARLEDRT